MIREAGILTWHFLKNFLFRCDNDIMNFPPRQNTYGWNDVSRVGFSNPRWWEIGDKTNHKLTTVEDGQQIWEERRSLYYYFYFCTCLKYSIMKSWKINCILIKTLERKQVLTCATNNPFGSLVNSVNLFLQKRFKMNNLTCRV